MTTALPVGMARLDEVDFGELPFSANLIASVEMKGVRGLRHTGPSDVTIQSALSLQQEQVVPLLSGCGLPDEEIGHFRSRLGKAIVFYRCFISSSDKDEEFAGRLYGDLQSRGIRCWKWNFDARTGRPMWGEIDEAIRVHDKVVLVASRHSLQSPPVLREIERALRREDESRIDVLFPVAIDRYVFDEWRHPRRNDVLSKVVADALGWREPGVYAGILAKLISDLKREPS